MDSAKTLCVMGLFDENANHAFSTLYLKMLQRGIPVTDQEPHLTFGIYNDLKEEKLLDWIDGIARTQKCIAVNFNHIGLFRPGICFAEPCANLELLSLHQRIHAKYDQDCRDNNCLYALKTKSWVPHSTLSVLPQNQVSQMIPALLEMFEPIQATITKIRVTEYSPLRNIRDFYFSL